MMKRAVSPDRERRWSPPVSTTTRKDSVVDLTGDSEEETSQKEAPQHPATAESMCLMENVHENDVLFSGPGGTLDTLNRHVGNVRFEKLCLASKDDYLGASSDDDQRLVAQHVVDAVNEMKPPGRFLKVSRSNGEWTGKESRGEELLGKVLQALRIILGFTPDKKRKRISFYEDATTAESTSREQGVVTPQSITSLPEAIPSQSALDQLASIAEATRDRPAVRAPPQVPVLSSRPLPAIAYDPNLLPVRYSNVNLSSLSDEFRHQIGLRDYVSDYYGGDYTRMATEHARLTACPHPDTWEVRLVEAAGRAFDICQKYISPNMELSGNQQLHTRTVIHNNDYHQGARASKRSRANHEGRAVERFNDSHELTASQELATETLCAGTVTDCKRTASRYILYIARQLYRSANQSGIAKWFCEEVLPVLERGKPEAQEVAVLLLTLAAMEVNQDEVKFGGFHAWSFAGMFVVGSSVKLVPVHNTWRTRQRTPTYIRRITGRLLHFHEIIFAGATVNCTRSREFARWRPILEEPGRLGKSFVMQDLSMKFRIARHFEKACDTPPAPLHLRAQGHARAAAAAAAAQAPPAVRVVPITPERNENNTQWAG